MGRKRETTMRLRALLVALTATSCCCCLLAAASGTTTTTSASTSSNPTSTNSVISNLLRRSGDQAPPATTTTINNLSVAPERLATATTIETKVPSITTPSATTATTTTTTTTTQQKLASHQLAQQLQQQQQQQQPATATTTTTAAATTSQFQYVRPVTSASVAPASPTTTIRQEPAVCQHNNRTYALGQTWNDDCLQVCQCVPGGSEATELQAPPLAISACKPRCPVYKDPPGDSCKLLRSKQDECCLEWSCELEAKFAPTSIQQLQAGPSTSTTVMQTERGELSMSTTEIRMPTTTTTTAAPATTVAVPLTTQATTTTTTSRPATVATTTTTTTSTTGQQTQPPRRAGKQQTQLIPTAATTTLRPQQPAMSSTHNRRPSAAPVSPSHGGAREPKHVVVVTNPSPTPRPGRPSDMTRSVDDSLPIVPVQQNNNQGYLSSSSPDFDETPEHMKFDLCINDDRAGVFNSVNTTWLVTTCNKPCRCVFRNEPWNQYTDVTRFPTVNLRPNSLATEIRCGLPAACQLPQASAAECARPLLRWPSKLVVQGPESCECPEIVCERPVAAAASALPTTQSVPSLSSQPATQKLLVPTTSQPTATTTTTTTTTTTPAPLAGCKLPGGRLMAPGETFNDECHSICRCTVDNELRCEQLNCPSEPLSDHLCVAWAPAEANFRQNSADNRCCPEFVCKVPVAIVASASNATTDGDRLVVVDENNKSTTTTTTTTDQEENLSEPPVFKSCHFMGKKYAHDERLHEQNQGSPRDVEDGTTSSDTCERVCTCLDGKIVCQPAPCPPLNSVPPEELNCPASLAFQLTEECCPKWACQLGPSEPALFGLQDIAITTINSSSVEIAIRLPDYAIGQRGIMVRNYTNLPLSNPDALQLEPPEYAHWDGRPTKMSNGTLPPIIRYTMTKLVPNSRYWVRFAVRFEAGASWNGLPLEEPLESKTHSFTMPPIDDLDESPTTTTTTASTPAQPSPPPTRTITPKSSTTRAPASSSTSSTTTTSTTSTTTTTTTTTTTQRPSSSTSATNDDLVPPPPPQVFTKPPVSVVEDSQSTTGVPCNGHDGDNRIDGRAALNGVNFSPQQPWGEYLHHQVQNAPIQRYAWHLLVAFSVMTILFTIVSYLYFKKSSRMIAPITSPYHHHHAFHQQSAYDNPTFTTKLVSYNANQPRVLLVDESYQNLDNLAKQKNMEVDKSSPLHHHHHHHKNGNNNNGHHTTTMIQHQNGRQHLI